MNSRTLSIVNEIVETAKKRGVARLIVDKVEEKGRLVTIKGKQLLNFGSYSYLGLEYDQRLIDASISATKEFGLQYPSSRVYASSSLYQELEARFEQIFSVPPIIMTSLTVIHQGVMPVVMQRGDVLLLDQQVHTSVQDAARKVQQGGVQLSIIRHNDIGELKKRLSEYRHSNTKVWYAIDGIYSMYGDTAPINDLYALLDVFPNLNLYVDDAHGVSSFGKNGCGWVLDKVPLHDKMILTTGMAKAFGTMGGIAIIKNDELREKVRNCAGPLIFSGPLPIPILGASVASATLHLSEEIYLRQEVLQEKITFCTKLLKTQGIPNISESDTPIFFIPLGLISVGYNLVERLIKEGIYVNLASFPAVPETCTGIRFTITLHNKIEDIQALVNALQKHYIAAIAEEGRCFEDVQKAFRRVSNLDGFAFKSTKQKSSSLSLQVNESITEISKTEWNDGVGLNDILSWDNLKLLENTFSGNATASDNWQFRYYIVVDKAGTVVAQTFFTIAFSKEDMFSAPEVSELIEKSRLTTPDFMVSKVLMMGTFLTEGKHLVANLHHAEWKAALTLILDDLWQLQEQHDINTIVLRDFPPDNPELNSFFSEQGFLRIQMPDNHILNLNTTDSIEQYLDSLSSRRRKYIRKKAMEKETLFSFEVIKEDIPAVKMCHQLYLNVVSRSYEINTFALPSKLFKVALSSSDWELLKLTLPEKDIVAMMLCFKGKTAYCPVLVGLDYDFLDMDIYPQILWQTVKRAKQLEYEQVNFGYTASQNKRKFGAEVVANYAFVQQRDTYNRQLISLSD